MVRLTETLQGLQRKWPMKSVWLQLGWLLPDAPQAFLCTHCWCPECNQAGDNLLSSLLGLERVRKEREIPQLALDGLFPMKWDMIIQFFLLSIKEKKNQASQIWYKAEKVGKHPNSILRVLSLSKSSEELPPRGREGEEWTLFSGTDGGFAALCGEGSVGWCAVSEHW